MAQACAAALPAGDRAAQALGIAIEEVRPGFAQLAMTVGEAMINGHAIAHGGVIFALADAAFAIACNSRDVAHVALDAMISFTAPAKLGGRFRAVAVERSLRGRTGVYDLTITNAAGELGACRSMPAARSKPPVPPNTSLLFGHNAPALLPHRASIRRNIRLRIGRRAYSDRLLVAVFRGTCYRIKGTVPA